MIDLKFALFWSGSKMSYLRYLTFKSLRKFHPQSKITLFVANKCKKSELNFEGKKQDFYDDKFVEKCFIEELKLLDVDVRYFDAFSDFHPNFQSDLFKWWWLSNFSGFYIDTDMLIVKSFDSLPLDKDLIFSQYDTKNNGKYASVNVIGSSGNSKTIKYCMDNIYSFYSKNQYTSIGSDIFKHALSLNMENNCFNAPFAFFNPISDDFMIEVIFRNNVQLSSLTYGIHWFGGNIASNEFNRVYTKDYIERSNDTISAHIKNIGINK